MEAGVYMLKCGYRVEPFDIYSCCIVVGVKIKFRIYPDPFDDLVDGLITSLIGHSILRRVGADG